MYPTAMAATTAVIPFRQSRDTYFLLRRVLLPVWQERLFPQPQETELQGHKLF